MDLKMKVCLFAMMALGSLAVASAQVECYDCSYTYIDEENEIDLFNCKNPSSSSTPTTLCSSSQGCYVSSTINSPRSSGFGYFASLSSPGGITYERGCADPVNCDVDCRKNPQVCAKCCTGDKCNSATLMDHLSENALSQTCYQCQYSEVPGQRSDAGCGLAFDATSSQVYEIECPGLCYSAKARFEHVEDIIRGCLYHGDQCSYDGLDLNGVPASVVIGRDNVAYDLACCTGDKCNTATALSFGIVAVLLSTFLGMFVIQL